MKPRTFKHFPKDATCPVCQTSDDGECVPIPIDGTQRDGIAEGIPVHLWCVVANRYAKGDGVLYRRADDA